MFSAITKRFLPRVRKNGKRGFTLIEVLIVVAITSLLSGMVLGYSSKGRTQVALYVEAAKLSQVILRAKSLAIATYNDPNTPCGYGVHIDYASKSYSLFSYNPAINDPLACGKIDQGKILTDDPNVYSVKSNDIYTLPQGMEYNPVEGSLSDILFISPDPQTLIWWVGDLTPRNIFNGQASVFIRMSGDPASSILVKVSPAGQVTF